MQNAKIFKVLAVIFQILLVASFAISVGQNYFGNHGTVSILGLKFHQFYDHGEVRLIPLLYVSFFFIPQLKKVLGLKSNYYASELLLAFLVFVDGFTHVTGIYSWSYHLPVFGEVWFDKYMHFTEGLLLFLTAFPLMDDYLEDVKHLGPAWSYWITVGFMSIFFVLWEIVELIIDRTKGTHLITSYYDTNEDLMASYLGLALGIIVVKLLRGVRNITSNTSTTQA